ncbi:MAG: MraY family glycosyltransferase [Raineya sp.]
MISIFIITFVVALVIAWASIPVIVKVAEQKHLYDEPDESRKSHTNKIPTLGGIAIFAGTVISATFFAHQSKNLDLGAFLSAMTILFFTGIKDDIIPLPPYKKFLAQLLATSIIVLWGEVRLSNLYGFFFIHQAPEWFLILATIFTIIVIINAFNLIDGINGLAGGIACIVLSTFGIWFYLYSEESLAIWAIATCGAVIGFLRYNLLQGKIFMGDTGSLLLGFITAVFAIQFIEMNNTAKSFLGIKAPIFAIAVLAIPLFDTIRVFVVRLIKGHSPFSGDRNHLHHLLLDAGFSHIQASLTLYALNLFVIFIAYLSKNLNVYLYLGVLWAIMLIFTQIFLILKQRRQKRQANKHINVSLPISKTSYELSSPYEQN